MDYYEIIYETDKIIIAMVNIQKGYFANKHICLKVKNPSSKVSATRWITIEDFNIDGASYDDLKDYSHPFYRGEYKGKIAFKTYRYNLEVPNKYLSKGKVFHSPKTILYEDNDNNFKIIVENKGGLSSEVYFEYNGENYVPNSDRFSDKFIDVWKKDVLNGHKISEKLEFGVDYAIKEPLISPLEFII